MMSDEKLQYLIDCGQKDGQITSYHFNDAVIDWWVKFYVDKPFQTGRTAFTYYMRKLVKSGVYHKRMTCGTGWCGKTDGGVTHQHFWLLVDHPQTKRTHPELYR